MNWPSQCAVVIPCLNEARTIYWLVQEVCARVPKVIVVDDGSSDDTAALAAQAGAHVIRKQVPSGKGAALKAGLQQALELGFNWAFVMDGDGQHSPSDIPAFWAIAERKTAALVIGNRMTNEGAMPWLRRRVNIWISHQLSVLTGRKLPDSQCGFRLLRLDTWATLNLRTTHFEIESEMLLAFMAAGFAVEFVPIRVIYKTKSSNIHPLRDTVRWFRWWRQARREWKPVLAGQLVCQRK